MTFAEAKAYVIPWGMYKGQTVDQAATTDRGLGWLDWMRGVLDTEGELEFAPERRAFREALRTYLDDATIAKDIANLAKS